MYGKGRGILTAVSMILLCRKVGREEKGREGKERGKKVIAGAVSLLFQVSLTRVCSSCSGVSSSEKERRNREGEKEKKKEREREREKERKAISVLSPKEVGKEEQKTHANNRCSISRQSMRSRTPPPSKLYTSLIIHIPSKTYKPDPPYTPTPSASPSTPPAPPDSSYSH